MNNQKLQNIAGNTSSVTTNEVDEIKQLISAYPFFSLPHVVLAKIYFEKEHYLFENALNQAAMRVSNREWLYHYIHGDEKFNSEKNAVFEQIVIPKIADQVIEEPLTIETSEKIKEPLSDKGIIEVKEETEEKSEAALVRNNLSAFLEEDELADNDSISEPNPLEQNVDEQRMEDPTELAVIQVDEENAVETIVENTEIEEDSIEIEEDNTTAGITENLITETQEELSVSENVDEKESEAGINEESTSLLGNHPDIYLRKNPVYNVEEFLKDGKRKNDSNEKGEKDFFYWLNHPAPEVKAFESNDEVFSEEIPETDSKLSIIEQFIKANPSISRPKKEFYSAENMAKRSEHPDFDLVTETLANIYYEQGNIALAIKAYEKLSLQNPLKQAYFASLIEKIKKEKR